MSLYGPTNQFATQSGNVPVSQLDQNFTDAFAGINNAYLVGTLGARPAPDGIGKGRYYFATDDHGGTLYRDNGSSWVQVAAPVTVSPAVPIAAAGGSADAITATYTPAITLIDQQFAAFVATAANTTTTPTFAPNGLTAHTITKKGGQALTVGDIPGALAVALVAYNLANTRWELLNPAAISASTGTLTQGTQLVLNPYAVSTVGAAGHGLGANPHVVVAFLENLSAEAGYASGDRIYVQSYVSLSTAAGFTISSDTANLTVSTNAVLPAFYNKASNAQFSITAANWKLVVVPYKIN